MKKIKLDKYYFWALFFLSIQILVLIRNYIQEDNLKIFYLCTHIALLLSIAFFLKNIPLIKSLICVGLPLQLLYVLDLIPNLLFNFTITEWTNYVLNYNPFELTITILMHFLTTFIAILIVYKEENKKISLLYSFIYLCLLYSTAYFFTPISYDTNCIHNSCNLEFLQFENNLIPWFLINIFIFVIPMYYLQEAIYKLYKRKNKI